jgi:hypothetical protein
VSEPASKHILLMGLRATGKTSFLAALWYMVEQLNSDCALTLDRLDGERKHLNTLRDAWLAYKSVDRTRADTEKSVSMVLRDKSTGALVKTSFPDLSGEAFLLQWTKRQITSGYDELMRAADGAILFIHPSRIVKPVRIDEMEDTLAAIVPAGTVVPTAIPSTFVPWNPELTPTQVQLVELVQIIMRQDYFRPPFRLAVIVSAFDLVGPKGLSPQEFIARELPLFDQFLKANTSKLELAIYGVSAQGAQYASPLLTSSMITDLPSVIKKLKEITVGPCAKIWADIDGDSKAVLAAGPSDPKTAARLVEKLNELISLPSFYDAQVFESVVLGERTKVLLDQHNRDAKKGVDLISLNRKLLEDVFPAEISKVWTNQAEQEAVQKLQPTKRVLMQGDGVSNSHDITEPIQWLMK